MDMQKIIVEIDGVEREAKIIDVLNLDNRAFAVYSVDNGNETSDIMYSEVIKDEEGYDKLINVTDPSIKERILQLVNVILS